MKKIKKFVAIALLFPFLAIGCSTFVKNSYYSMDATGVTYNTVMTGVSAAQVTGKISTEQRAIINRYGSIFKNGYIVAVDGLLAYKNNPSTDTQTAVTYSISTALANWIDLTNFINSILPGTVPVYSMNSLKLRGKTTAGQKFEVSIKKLDTGEISVIIQIGAAVIQYLIPAIQSLINDFGKITISDEDIIALKTLIKDPDQY